MIRIYINGRFLTQTITGVQRFAIELVKAMDVLVESKINSFQFDIVLLVPPDNIVNELNLKNIKTQVVGHLKGHLWDQIELPYYSRKGLLVSLCNASPLLAKKQIVVIHDAAVFGFPQAYSLIFRTWYKVLLLSLGRLADKIITVSCFSKQELKRHAFVNSKKVHVVYAGKEHVMGYNGDNMILKKHGLENKRYVLAVSSMSPNKNFASIVKAIQLLGQKCEMDFVIAGGTNPEVFNNTSTPLPVEVKHVGYVSDAELKALYENALCFVFPSFYEGFGLPPLEAMACGCPVIVSNTASLPEVCGDAALYCDPHNPQDIADKISVMINGHQYREDIRQKGLTHSCQFSWEKCAHEVMQVIEGVLNK